jgi:hypothetical protein
MHVLRSMFSISLLLLTQSILTAALVIEPVINRVEGSGPAENNFPLYDPTYVVNGVQWALANEPGELFTYVAGDPPEPLFQTIHGWNNTNYNITGLLLRIVGRGTDTEDPGTIVRGPVDAVWGDVNGDSQIGSSDIFNTITVSADGKELRFDGGLIPVGGRFSDVHLAVSDDPPFLAGVDSTFSGDAVPEPYTFILTGAGLSALLFYRLRKRRAGTV